MSSRREFVQTLTAGIGAQAVFGSSVTPDPERQPVDAGAAALRGRLEEAIYAFVVADAMGGSIENFLPAQVKAQFADWDFTRFLPPTSPRDIASGTGKGNGRTTDDSINFEVLINAYIGHGDHLDAYAYAEAVLREHQRSMYVAERGAEIKPVDRPLWWPERYVYQRLAINNIEPRYAGIGNYINEGFQGIVLPIGAINVGDPWRAYTECVGIGAVHSESFGIEAAAVNAAAYAVAFQAGSTIPEVLAAATRYAKDGTALALRDVLAVTDSADDIDTFVAKARRAVLPYLQLSPSNASEPDVATPKLAHANSNIARPSRIAAVENFPVALACLSYGNGDYPRTLRASLFYGRDGETIAAVSTSLLAAVRGAGTVPAGLKHEVDSVNRRNYAAISQALLTTIAAVHTLDSQRLARRAAQLG